MHRSRSIKLAKVVSTTLVVIVAVGAAMLTVIVPRVTGSTSLTVLTGSMSPTIPAGSVVLVKPLDPSEVEEGDVITFQAEPGKASYITHRVIEIEDEDGQLSFITKGDANRGADFDPVPAGAVRGRVMFHVPYVGSIADTIKTPFGLLLLVGVPSVLYIVFQSRELLEQFRQRKAGTIAVPSAGEHSGDHARAVVLAAVRADLARRREFTALVASVGGTVLDVQGDRIVSMVVASPPVLDEFELQLDRWPDRDVRRSSVVSLDAGSEPVAPAEPTEAAEAAEASGEIVLEFSDRAHWLLWSEQLGQDASRIDAFDV